ncbi:hypothetical protein L873DRAFT_317239 [Choiromyces venosus 120613-1]|uniref:Uncharacterized protein n=1 Tax=Choiromyces venosus 120613-1 TaxID=1336337 RepID=A0A3N4JC56_9PEZI|nr:hypothetical protein L873DRAFT_317239 [Choiromyces venosus 120613-1]
MSFFESCFPSLSQNLIRIPLLHNRGCNFMQLPYRWRESKAAAKITPFYNYSLLFRQKLLPLLTLLFAVFSSLLAMHHSAWSCSNHRCSNRQTWSHSCCSHFDRHLFSYSYWNRAVFLRHN